MKTKRSWKLVTGTILPSLALLAFAVVSEAERLTETEMNQALAQLSRTRQGVIEETKGLSETQLKFKAATNRWSVAEILEHIAVTESIMFDYVSKTVMQAPSGQADRDYSRTDAYVLTTIADRTHKVQAPEPLLPTGRWSPQEALEFFLRTREQTVEFLKDTPGLRQHVVDSPLGQPLDGYQWLLYISAHSERHTRQIAEVKADPNFPKK